MVAQGSIFEILDDFELNDDIIDDIGGSNLQAI